jgi:L,D-transpeptidase catalytic domain
MSVNASRGGLVAAVGALALAHALTLGTAGAAAETPAATTPAGSTPATTPTTPTPEAAPAPRAPLSVVLSNETTSTTWAHPLEEVAIHSQPSLHSRTIARTHLATEDGFPEVYLLLSELTDSSGNEWVRMRVPGRPNGRIGWVPRAALAEFHVTHWMIEIALGARRLRAFYQGRLRLTAPVGVGKPSTPTPPGRFWVREIFKLADRSNPYWPYALGTSDYSTLTDWPGGGVVGIHGDFGEPKLIPGDPSHGCVRMHARDLAWLAPRLTLGTPVHIVR